VSLPPFLREMLERHIAEHPGTESYVFGAPEGGPIRLGNFRRRVWSKAVRTAGLQPLRIHDLRHTAVSLWVAEGANPKHVAVMAGHTSVSVVLDRYGHLLPGNETHAATLLDTYLTPTPTPSTQR
jgi:integrase